MRAQEGSMTYQNEPFREASDAVDNIIGLMIDAIDAKEYAPMDGTEMDYYNGLFDLAEELVDTLNLYREHVGGDSDMEVEIELE
jgi:hypothetical protein